MLTGTPLDLTPFGAVLNAIGFVYWALAAVALWLATRGSKPRRTKGMRIAVVLLIFGFLPATQGWQAFAAKRRLDESLALFKKHCESAGEKIHKTVENVEGVVWMKWRPVSGNQSDQYRLDDPYGHDCGGDDCISQMLRVVSGEDLKPEVIGVRKDRYRYIESVDPATGAKTRFTLVIKAVRQRTPEQLEAYKKNTGIENPDINVYDLALERAPIDAYKARYGITWDDLSTKEDRDHWIAGSSLKVVDLQTNEVIAERVGYMMDRAQGSTGRARQP